MAVKEIELSSVATPRPKLRSRAKPVEPEEFTKKRKKLLSRAKGDKKLPKKKRQKFKIRLTSLSLLHRLSALRSKN
jgi:hypothetical protein